MFHWDIFRYGGKKKCYIWISLATTLVLRNHINFGYRHIQWYSNKNILTNYDVLFLFIFLIWYEVINWLNTANGINPWTWSLNKTFSFLPFHLSAKIHWKSIELSPIIMRANKRQNHRVFVFIIIIPIKWISKRF